jgi:hypothetical protein
MYTLLPSADSDRLFFNMHGEAAERHGSIGYLRANFGKSGDEFWAAWVANQKHLYTHVFDDELLAVTHSLRFDGPEPTLACRRNLERLCQTKPGMDLPGQGCGYYIQTKRFSYYFRCLPNAGNYEVCCFAYDNRWLLPELAGQHELPDICYSLEPSSESITLIKCHEHGYYPCDYSTDDPEYNRELATDLNRKLGVTRGQEEAMVIGSMFGWNSPAAKPWTYDRDGGQLPLPPKRNEIVR